MILPSVQTDSLSYKQQFSPNYIDIPVNITYKLPLGRKTNFFVSAGPYIGFFYTGKQSTETRILEQDDVVRLKKKMNNRSNRAMKPGR